ncbi:MAG TPA: ribosomal protein S18-alanine N-acetyltransferase [Bryobacteraceae bacterium]|jgi:ribosomal-protein-alanine N-acetyltransferase
MPLIRPGQTQDLPEVAAVQQASPQAAQWTVAEYLQYDFRVSVADGRVTAFLVSRTLAEGEYEILNLAVSPDFRRRGLGRELLKSLLAESPGTLYLEVRESNEAARMFYKSIGFQEIAARSGYYETPGCSPESAIVMKFHSC